MSEADEYGPGGYYTDGPNTEFDRLDEEPHQQFVSIPVSEFDELLEKLKQIKRDFAGLANENLELREKMDRAERERDKWERFYDSELEKVDAHETRLAKADKFVEALRDAIWAADYLVGQQAMPDDGYRTRLENAREVLTEYEDGKDTD